MIRTRTKAALLGVVVWACGLVVSGCWLVPPASTFEIKVVPEVVADLAQNASCFFLVTVTELGAGSSAGPVALEAGSWDGMVFLPATLEAGQVGEARVWGTGIPVDTTESLTITGRRGTETHSATATAVITQPIESPDDRLVTGAAMRDAFIPWLASDHPELGINADTEWTAVPLRPHILEVSYYLFLSDEWELAVWWHVMIPPYDWARMYLRHRDTESAPSFGAEISSVSAHDEPHTMTPPEEIWR